MKRVNSIMRSPSEPFLKISICSFGFLALTCSNTRTCTIKRKFVTFRAFKKERLLSNVSKCLVSQDSSIYVSKIRISLSLLLSIAETLDTSRRNKTRSFVLVTFYFRAVYARKPKSETQERSAGFTSRCQKLRNIHTHCHFGN